MFRLARYSILPVNDPQEIAKLGYYEAAFLKLVTKESFNKFKKSILIYLMIII